jgi:hypothetical protein
LEDQPVTLVALHDDVVMFFDSQNVLLHEPIKHFVQLRFARAVADQTGDEQLVELIDGQRLAGRVEWTSVQSGYVPWCCPA